MLAFIWFRVQGFKVSRWRLRRLFDWTILERCPKVIFNSPVTSHSHSSWTLKTTKTKHKMNPSKHTAQQSTLTKMQSKLTLMQSKLTKQKLMQQIHILTAVSKTIPLTSIKIKLLSKTKQKLVKMQTRSCRTTSIRKQQLALQAMIC